LLIISKDDDFSSLALRDKALIIESFSRDPAEALLTVRA